MLRFNIDDKSWAVIESPFMTGPTGPPGIGGIGGMGLPVTGPTGPGSSIICEYSNLVSGTSQPTGFFNTIYGCDAGIDVGSNNNTIIGFEAGYMISSGGGNVIIGGDADVDIASRSYTTVIGTSATGIKDNGLFFRSDLASVDQGFMVSYNTDTGQMGPNTITEISNTGLNPTMTDSYDLGTIAKSFRDLYIDGMVRGNVQYENTGTTLTSTTTQDAITELSNKLDMILTRVEALEIQPVIIGPVTVL
jgi:hypothetical protein